MAASASAEWQVVSDVLCASGEVSFWSAREDRLYWIDPPLKRAWRLHLPSGRAEHWGFSGPITGLAPCRSGGFVLLLADGLYHAGAWLDVPTLLVPLPPIDADSLWRAGTCDPWGRLWLVAQTRPAARRHGPSCTLYCLRARSSNQSPLESIRQHVGDCLGLCWSPDGRSAYWSNTHLGEVVQAALSQGNGRTVLDLAVPALYPSGLCLGGSDGRTLFATSMRAGLSAPQLAHHPQSGAVFARRVGTPGLPAPLYWD